SLPALSKLCGEPLVSSANLYPGPPMPVPCGSPPWIMNFGITRWIIVPSYRRSFDFLPVDGCVHSRLPSARSMKFFTVFGASFSNNLQTIFPSVVSNTAYVPGCRAISFQISFHCRNLLIVIPRWVPHLRAFRRWVKLRSDHH